jgi:signal transduction histidine kinase
VSRDLLFEIGVEELPSSYVPPALDQLGLKAALTALVNDFAVRAGLDVTIKTEAVDGGDRLPAAVELALYRIVQEALTNVGRHAEARRVDVGLNVTPDHASVTVIDDGRGFDRQHLTRRTLGLLGMQERATTLGGTVDVQSAPGAGTRIVVNIPVSGKGAV